MKKAVLLGAAAGGLLVVVLIFGAFATKAANQRYAFVIRGIVTKVDTTNKTINLDVTKATGKAYDDLAGKNTEFKLTSPTYYKYSNATAKDTRVTLGSVAVGQEVGVKGVAKDDDTYHITWLRIHDRSFETVGLLKNHNTGAKTVKILVQTSTYKQSSYKDLEVTMNYTGDSVFYNTSCKNDVVFDDVRANDQKVKVKGKIIDSSTWEIAKLCDEYKTSYKF